MAFGKRNLVGSWLVSVTQMVSAAMHPKLKPRLRSRNTILGGSWVVISEVISPLIWVIGIVTLLITLLTTTFDPPSRPGWEEASHIGGP